MFEVAMHRSSHKVCFLENDSLSFWTLETFELYKERGQKLVTAQTVEIGISIGKKE